MSTKKTPIAPRKPNGHVNRIADVIAGEEVKKGINIAPPNEQKLAFLITGTSPYCQHKFTQKAFLQMKEKQEAGPTANKGKKREAKNFKEHYEQAQYKSKQGWNGIPANAFKAAMVSACGIVGFQMTKAKKGLWVFHDGVDATSMKPLVRITKGKPSQHEEPLPNDNGKMDIRVRPLWDSGWQCIVRVGYDADMFTAEDVANLLHRVGIQVGIGEGRPDSRHCVGIGWGLFEIERS